MSPCRSRVGSCSHSTRESDRSFQIRGGRLVVPTDCREVDPISDKDQNCYTIGFSQSQLGEFDRAIQGLFSQVLHGVSRGPSMPGPVPELLPYPAPQGGPASDLALSANELKGYLRRPSEDCIFML